VKATADHQADAGQPHRRGPSAGRAGCGYPVFSDVFLLPADAAADLGMGHTCMAAALEVNIRRRT